MYINLLYKCYTMLYNLGVIEIKKRGVFMRTQISMRLNSEAVKNLEEMAIRENRTKTNMIECLIMNYKK